MGTLEKIISDSLRHALLSMLTTSATTAGAFYAGAVSDITALKCFAVFAGTAVLINYVMMVTLVPAAMVIYEKWCGECSGCSSAYRLTAKSRLCNYFMCQLPSKLYFSISEWSRILFEKILPCVVVRLRYFWLLVFWGAAVFGIVAVFYRPRLRLPSSNEFQVFSSDHPFEVYDFVIKDQFWFEKAAGASNPTLPLTIIWGVTPIDNGDKLNPYSEVTLEFDPTFNVSSPDSQQWLLEFCQVLRSYDLYQSTPGLQLTNCFIENFRRFMERGCEGVSGEDFSPCCRVSSFPFEPHIFQKCVKVYNLVLAQTRALYFSNSHAGLRYHKSSNIALIVEFNSKQPFSFRYDAMREFYLHMNNWTEAQMQNAPAGMRHGWFISHLEFYDLQHSIAQGTPVAIGVSLAVATTVAFLTTLNVLITVYAVVTIAGSIFTTVGILVVLGWELNILESVTISIAVGLSIDFCLHYAMAYRLSPHSEREMRVLTSLSRMGSPVAMAAFTTFFVGLVMMPSTVLAYKKLGTFLMIVMSVSWAFATFFFQALLRSLGPPGGFGQFSWPSCDCFCFDSDRDHVDKTIYTMSESTLSSNHGNGGAELHELEPLNAAERSETGNASFRRSSPSHHQRYTRPSRYQHRLSESSAGSDTSPRSRRLTSSPEVRLQAALDSPPYTRKSAPSGTENAEKGSHRREASEQTAEHNGLKCSGGVTGENSPKDTVVALDESCSQSDAQTIRVQVAQSEPNRGNNSKSKIETDSNSNRTDKHTAASPCSAKDSGTLIDPVGF